jgi:leucine dehydrogenase
MILSQFDEHSVFSQLDAFGHQKVIYCSDPSIGLKAIIAIHDTTLGPALGGTRMQPYKSEYEALQDVLRLSRSMTYKSAITGLNLGGGKAVIIGDSRLHKSEALMRRFGRFIENLNGSFITAEDVGTNPRDMEYIRKETKHVTGIPESIGGSGDPSPVTAKGVFMGIKACLKEHFGNDSLAGKSIAVQGIGQVGENLVGLLRNENAKVYISDIDEDRLRQVAQKYGATVNTETINRLKCSIIAGSANNQLADEVVHGYMLLEKGIMYAPDYLINAGGLINWYSEIAGFNKKKTLQMTENIYDVTRRVLQKSKLENIPTNEAANKIAEKRIEDIRKIKASY